MIIPIDDAFDATVDALRRGGVVAIPTDTVYGLAALPGDRAAMQRLFELKKRSDAKSIAVLVSDLDQAQTLTTAELGRFGAFWPGALTVIVPRSNLTDLHLGGNGETVGIRCPDFAFVRRLAHELGPIAATSANRSGATTCSTAEEVATEFPELSIVVDGGPSGDLASTVVDATTSPPSVLRVGPVTPLMLGLTEAHGG